MIHLPGLRGSCIIFIQNICVCFEQQQRKLPYNSLVKTMKYMINSVYNDNNKNSALYPEGVVIVRLQAFQYVGSL